MMEQYYKEARLILCILSVVISIIMLHNEDNSFIIGGTVMITIAVLVAGTLTTPIAKKLISVGDKLEKKVQSTLFYFAVIPGGILMAVLGTIGSMVFFDKCMNVEVDLGGALIVVFIFAVIFIALVVPYIQVLIVLALKARNNKKRHKT